MLKRESSSIRPDGSQQPNVCGLCGEIHLILDNARYHHASILNEFLENNPHIILEFLLPYSPELNAKERVWKIIRSKGTHNRYFPSIGNLIMAVTKYFALYSRPNNV